MLSVWPEPSRRVARAERERASGARSAPRPRRSRRAQVPRHDRLRRSRVHAELQPVRRRRPAEQLDRPGRLLRAADRRRRPAEQDGPVARAQLEVDRTATRRSRSTSPRTRSGRTASRSPSADVVYSLTAGRQDKTMDRIGLVGAGNNVASIKAEGRYGGRDHAEDGGLAVHPGDPEPPVRRPEAHLVEGDGARNVHEPEARSARARSTRSPASRPRTTSSARTRTTGRQGCRKSRASSTCRRPRTTPPWR